MHQVGLIPESFRPIDHHLLLRIDRLDQRPLAIKTADACAAAAPGGPVQGFRVGVYFVQVENRTLGRIARVLAPHPRRVGFHGPHLAVDVLRGLPQPDGVVVGLGHLLPVEPRHFRVLGQQRLGLRQHDAAASLQITEQPFAVAYRQVPLFGQQCPGTLQGLGIALFQVGAAQVLIDARRLAAHLLQRRKRVFLEPGLPAEHVVEAAGDLAHQFQVSHLVGPDRHIAGAIHQDVRRLQHGIAEKPVGAQVPVVQLRLHVPVGRRPLQPANRRDHRQQQVQFGVLRHLRLDEDGRGARVDARGQPVDDHVEGVPLDILGIVVAGGERMPVSDEEIALVLVLQPYPVLDYPVVVTEVQAPGRAHAGSDLPAGIASAHISPIFVARVSRRRAAGVEQTGARRRRTR